MIKEEYVLTRNDGVEIYRHYSDEEKYIIQVETGIKYEMAEDQHPCKYTYVESDEYLPSYIEKRNREIDNTYTDDVIEKIISAGSSFLALDDIHNNSGPAEPTIMSTAIEAEFEVIDSNEIN